MRRFQNRREFIRTASTGVVGLGAASRRIPDARAAEVAAGKVKVAVVRNERAVDDRNVCDKKQVALMLEKALFAVTGRTDHRGVWSSLGVTGDDVVAIKVNCNRAGFPLYTHPELVYTVCESLLNVVPPNNIIIYERYTSELVRAGFKENTGKSGVRCFGTDRGGGFHPKEGLTRIVTDTCTKIINMPTLKAFGPSYVGSLFLKNHIGSLPPSEMPRCHGDTEMITRVNASPSIRNKSVIGICDGLRGNYKRGVPWYWKGIIVGTDQVAAEFTALEVINEKLKQEKENPNEVPSYVRVADTAYGLGTCDPGRIETLKLSV